MLGVMRYAGRIAMPPNGINFKAVLLHPIDWRVLRRIEPSLFAHFANGGIAQAFAGVLTAGNRLPVAWVVGALEEKDLQSRRVNDNENRDGKLEFSRHGNDRIRRR